MKIRLHAFAVATAALGMIAVAPAQADRTWLPFQVVHNDQPSGSIEIAFSAGSKPDEKGDYFWTWKVKSNYNLPVSGIMQMQLEGKTYPESGGFDLAAGAIQTEGQTGGQFGYGPKVAWAKLRSLKVGDRVVIEDGKIKSSSPTNGAGRPANGNPGVDEIEFIGKTTLGPDENFGAWKSLDAAGAISARVRRLGPKTAAGQYAWGYEVKNTSKQNQRFTVKLSGGTDTRQETLLLAPNEVFRGQFSTKAESQINLQATDITAGADSVTYPGGTSTVIMTPATTTAKPAAPTGAMDEATRTAKLEELNQKLMAGLGDLDPTNPNASFAAMSSLTDQMWTLMESDPDSDTKKMVSLLRQFSKADADTQTTLLAQLMALIMTLAE